MNTVLKLITLVLTTLFCACSGSDDKTLFVLLPAEETGVSFSNDLVYDKEFNIYTYRNFYNGGGVAIGDINKDGLDDIYFSSNMDANRLYLNKGDLVFEDITEQAGVAGNKAWSTGVAMVDVNADGWLDIYVCNSGDIAGDNKQNELFINQGDGTFKEQAELYGIADQGLSTHGVFFDYDRDNDLDLYLLNNSFRAIGSFSLKSNERPVRDSIGGDKLYENVGGTFIDVSEQAGIYGSVIGFGLGVTVGDINRDGWQDIYVSNDFFERDYIYMNNGDGTFRENLTDQMKSISAASMGADMGDLNNDGFPEVFVTEMLPEKDRDIKQKTTFEDWNKYQENLRNDYFHQFTRNMLQLNNGDGTFSEIGRLAGVEATDWSWGALIMDLENDGLRDIFVANGIYQDLTDQDYIDFIANSTTQRMIITRQGVDFKTLIDSIPIRPVSNYAFHQTGHLSFENRALEYGLALPSHSNGSAYSDLDNDGDLDLVINNVNMPAFIYRNETSEQKENHFLQLALKGAGKNINAIGSKVTLYYDNGFQYAEHMPMRGFQSSMTYKMHFGLGRTTQVDSIKIEWPSGKESLLAGIELDQLLQIEEGQIEHRVVPFRSLMTDDQAIYFKKQVNPFFRDFQHQENQFSDFDRDRLIYHMMSTAGPRLNVGDVNGDELEDVFIGGAKDSRGRLFIQTQNGGFIESNQEIFERNKLSEDTESIFFDADEDGDLDLYVASGGNEFPSSSFALVDRLYLNDGRGGFQQSDQMLPTKKLVSTSTVKASDYDRDGDLDLFVGARLQPFNYGQPVSGYLLENNGKGKFEEVTDQVAPQLKDVGMITDAIWADIDGDRDDDLVVVGEWMPILFFRNEAGKLNKIEGGRLGSGQSYGWWNCIRVGDFNGDHLPDFVIGNHGLNSRFRASKGQPLKLYVNDFDNNGTAEQILARYEDNKLLPFVRKHELVTQLPELKKKYLRFSNYVGESVEDVFGKTSLDEALVLQAEHLASSLLMSNGDGTYELKALPKSAQLSPMFGISIDDYNQDGNQDILLGGNFYNAKPEVGRYDASYGLLLLGDSKGNFTSISSKTSGFRTDGEVRDIESIKIAGKTYLIVARNNDSTQVFEILAKQIPE